MSADWSLGNVLSYNDPWAQDYGNKRFAHCETTGGLALFAVHIEGHMNKHHAPVQTLQGPQPSPRRWRIATPCSTAKTCANLGETGVRDPLAALFCFRLSARVPKRSTSKQRVWR